MPIGGKLVLKGLHMAPAAGAWGGRLWGRGERRARAPHLRTDAFNQQHASQVARRSAFRSPRRRKRARSPRTTRQQQQREQREQKGRTSSSSK